MIETKSFFDVGTSTLTHVVWDTSTWDGVLIDPVLDFNPASGKVSHGSAQILIHFLEEKKINLKAILETHAHADHLSSAQLFKSKFLAPIWIGKKIMQVQSVFKEIFNLKNLKTDGSQFDGLFEDFEEKKFGSILVKAIPTPGHTPACMSYKIENNVFVGDAIFMPDSGTGRCDFPKGSAETLFLSITKNIFSLPDDTKVFVGHDYQPQGRGVEYQTTVGKLKKENIQLNEKITLANFVECREKRDKTLDAPRLLLPSIQVNINAGHLPEKEDNGKRYLKLPLNED